MFYFGVDYYPEHWPEERWPKDARLMAEAGFNVVRLAEFAWSRLEPQEGRFVFDWLDRAISILAVYDIRVVLGTPTASPPPWLMTKAPDPFLVREDGQRATFGNRREYCPNNPVYHGYTRRIVTQMAEHYADNPSVTGWQIDNEFGQRCYCPICTRAFQEWLQQRYSSLDEVNEKWGTIFWSHVYTNWGQIPIPVKTGGSPNPGLALDYCRFMTDTYTTYQQLQADILRQTCPDHLITHNFMGFWYDQLNYFDLAGDLDFVAWDNYPRGFWNMQTRVAPSFAALSADTMRGLKQQNVWVMEQQSGASGWEIVGAAPQPGELRLWAYQSIAHGADAVVFFRWRTARFGTEEYWHGVLDHHGIPGRRYEEIAQMGQEIAQIGEQIHGSAIKPHVALILDYDSRFAFQIQANNPQFSYSSHFYHIYQALHRQNVPIDVISPSDDLSPYKLVIAPALHIVTADVAERLTSFVEAGGILVVTARSGVKDASNAVVNQYLPGLLAELCGVQVEEYDSLPADTRNALEFAIPELASAPAVSASAWCDVLKPTTARVVARYTKDYYAGKPVITVNEVEQGRAVYVGTFGDAELYQALLGWLLMLADVQPLLTAPEGVEVAERWQGNQRLLFLLNHTDQEQHVSLDGHFTSLLEETTVEGGEIAIAAKDILILAQA